MSVKFSRSSRSQMFLKIGWYVKTRVTSCELRVTSYELRVESLKARVEIQKCEFKSTSYEFKSTSYEFKSTNLCKNFFKECLSFFGDSDNRRRILKSLVLSLYELLENYSSHSRRVGVLLGVLDSPLLVFCRFCILQECENFQLF